MKSSGFLLRNVPCLCFQAKGHSIALFSGQTVSRELSCVLLSHFKKDIGHLKCVHRSMTKMVKKFYHRPDGEIKYIMV